MSRPSRTSCISRRFSTRSPGPRGAARRHRVPDAHRVLCEGGPFRNVDVETFAALLRSMGKRDLLTQMATAFSSRGSRERIINHYFVFCRLRVPRGVPPRLERKTLGTMPLQARPRARHVPHFRRSALADRRLRSGAASWISNCRRAPTADLHGGAALVHDRVRDDAQDLPVYGNSSLPRRPSPELAEGRQNFFRLGLGARSLVQAGTDVVLFPWVGDRAMHTIALLLRARGLDVEHDGVGITVMGISEVEVTAHLSAIVSDGPPDPVRLASQVLNKASEKYDGFLDDALLDMEVARRDLDIEKALEAL